jgi:hypothetical protein
LNIFPDSLIVNKVMKCGKYAKRAEIGDDPNSVIQEEPMLLLAK